MPRLRPSLDQSISLAGRLCASAGFIAAGIICFRLLLQFPAAIARWLVPQNGVTLAYAWLAALIFHWLGYLLWTILNIIRLKRASPAQAMVGAIIGGIASVIPPLIIFSGWVFFPKLIKLAAATQRQKRIWTALMAIGIALAAMTTLMFLLSVVKKLFNFGDNLVLAIFVAMFTGAMACFSLLILLMSRHAVGVPLERRMDDIFS